MADIAVNHLQSEQLTKLLSIGQDRALPPAPEDRDALTADLLRARLGAPMWLSDDERWGGSDTLERARLESSRKDAPTLRQVLVSRDADVAEIGRTKSLGKRAADAAHKDPPLAPEYWVGLTVYYAATAAALLRGVSGITGLSDEDMRAGFALLAAKPWMDTDLADLFRRASEHLPPREPTE